MILGPITKKLRLLSFTRTSGDDPIVKSIYYYDLELYPHKRG